MKNYPKKLVKKVAHHYNLVGLYNLMKRGPLHDDGWFRSVREAKCVDGEGNPLIWFNFPAIDFIKNRVTDEMVVFEFGAGASTLWWAKRARRVISCEHDESWFKKLQSDLPDNIDLFHVPLENGDDYPEKISNYNNQIDIVVIDGRRRNECASTALSAVNKNGVIIWDNSELQEYEAGQNVLLRNGFKKLEFCGMPPGNNVKTETAIFYRGDNCFNI